MYLALDILKNLVFNPQSKSYRVMLCAEDKRKQV